MLRLRAVTRSFGSRVDLAPVLQDISLSIESGELCALTGPSGSGKTTLMNLVGLLDRPTSGSIELCGIETSTLSPNEMAETRNRILGFVFQSFHLLSHLTALDNVALPLLYRGIGISHRRDRAAHTLEQVGISSRALHRPDELSGGQRQRVAIARALVGEPKFLLADEPTGNLDSQSASDIMSLFIRLNQTLGLTCMIVTHDPTIAARCPRRIVIRDGRVFDDSTAPLREHVFS